MTTENPSYELAEVTCEKKNCNETFSVVISSIHTVASKPVGEIELTSSRHDETAEANRIDDFVDIKCVCGHNQRVHLKMK